MTIGAILLVVGLLWVLMQMTALPLIQLLFMLLIWGVTGLIAGRLVRGRDFGVVGNVLLGFLGGIVGAILFALLGLWRWIDSGLIGQMIVGVIGSVVLIYLMRLIDRNFAR